MANLNKPSTPTVTGKSISVDSIVGAVKYTLYKVRYIFRSAFRLSDGRHITTYDGTIFTTKNSKELYVSSYTGEQIDEAVRRALTESST